MKEMEYKAERDDIILDKGIIDGIRYIVKSVGTHPCIYLGIPNDHPLAGFFYDQIPIEVHGGLTYSDKGNGEYLPEGYYWYGWDYAHLGDYAGYQMKYENNPSGEQYTTEELVKDAKSAIYDFSRLKDLAETIYMKDR